MNNQASEQSGPLEEKRVRGIDIVEKGLAKRYRAERRFRLYGLGAIVISLLFLSIVFVSIFSKGYTAFVQTYVKLDIYFDTARIQKDNLAGSDYQGLVKATLRKAFPGVKSRVGKKQLYSLVSPGASYQLRGMVEDDPSLIGKTVPVWIIANDDVDMLMKGNVDRKVPEESRRLKDDQLHWIDRLKAAGESGNAFQLDVLRIRRFSRARAGRHPWGAYGIASYSGGHAVAFVSHRCGRGHVPGGVCPQEPVYRSY